MARPITAPRVPDELTLLDLSATPLRDELELDETRLTGAAAAGQEVTGVELRSSVLADVELTGMRLPRLDLRGCRISGGNLANTLIPGGFAERCAFERVRMTGLAWHEGVLRDVTFTGCRIDLASFAASQLERVRFQDCTLAQSDLQELRMAAVVFEDCDLRETDFAGARLGAGCELRGCLLDGARGVEHLRGARMPYDDVLANAATLAGALGISVLDEQDGDEGR